MLSWTEIECVVETETPRKVTVNVPRLADSEAINVTVMFPFVVTEGGLNCAVIPGGKLSAVRLTGCLNPRRESTEIVTVAESPWRIDSEGVEDCKEKSGEAYVSVSVTRADS